MHYDKQSESYSNMEKAFGDEAKGHVRYKILEDDARQSGNEDLARLYGELAGEELYHAKLWYKEAGMPTGDEALSHSISHETDEAAKWYPEMAAKAELEGYEGLADRFIANGKAEANHRQRLTDYKGDMEKGARYSHHEEVLWCCTVCGYCHTGTTPPKECPLCGYSQRAFRKA